MNNDLTNKKSLKRIFMLVKTDRTEQEIFSDLDELSKSPGYAHAIAYFCHRDNTFSYNLDEGVISKDVLQQFSYERLVRTEVSALIGLIFKNSLELTIPEPFVLQEYVNKTEELLQELHYSMMPRPDKIFNKENLSNNLEGIIGSGAMLREAMFYGGESAFHFQYRDLCLKKYANDDDFFLTEKGYSLTQAYEVIFSLDEIQNKQLNSNMEQMVKKHPNEWTYLPSFIFSYELIANESGFDISVVKAVLDSFTAIDSNESYQSIDSFNLTNAYPILKISDDEFILFQYYSLVEAFYETPFFWFLSDSSYKSKALINRGAFTEEFAKERLERVFGKEHVFTNVNIYGSDGNIAGEIDVLVIYANRVIVLQAKSKKLTLKARQGSKVHIEDDFQKAVQAAYNQGLSCAEFMLEPDKYKLKADDGSDININIDFKEIYIMCVVSDHYPALFTQSQQFLKYQQTDIIKPPYVADVFLLDTLTEMLDSPIHFLSYINRRALYSKQIQASFELTVLGYHLSKNLWLEEENSFIHLADDICADLDLAMMARRRGIPGNKTPEGILTKYEGTYLDKLFKSIEEMNNSNIIDFGFLLLFLSEDTINSINQAIDKITKLSLKDGETHDLTMFFNKPSIGFTIHTNNYPKAAALKSLGDHCERRKYTSKAAQWHGICLSPEDGTFRFGVTLDFTWKHSFKMGEIVKNLPLAQKTIDFNIKNKARNKIGRNEPCPCNSGKKFKKCCILSC